MLSQRHDHAHLTQVKEILAYAAQRFIDVVPEIELPGHCGAALASYPYLGCRGDQCMHTLDRSLTEPLPNRAISHLTVHPPADKHSNC